MPTQKIAAIIAEYNPFHSGHAWMIAQLREKGYDTVACVMSGPFVQRGEGALLPTASRAEAAVLGGADLVFRLPVGWATASAEVFGAGGVHLAAALGCVEALAFGAETPDTGLLMKTARLLLSSDFSPILKKQLRKGVSFAAARAAAAEECLPGSQALLRNPNNILGVEYCKALLELGGQHTQASLPVPLALPRMGAEHDGPPREGFASASHLRELCRTAGIEALAPYLPPACIPVYRRAAEEGRILSPRRQELALLARLRLAGEAAFNIHPTAGEGLGARLAAAAQRATTLDELYALAKTKRFAHSRIRRLALATALGLSPMRLSAPSSPPFLHLLAASKRGLCVLKCAKENATLPFSTSLAKLAKTSSEAAACAAEEARAEDMHALILETPAPGGQAFTRKVHIHPN